METQQRLELRHMLRNLGRHEIIVGALALAAGVTAVAAYIYATTTGPRARLNLPPASGWTERHWPLRFDPWWPSKSFVCPASRCGADLQLYIRVKTGFCNCETGVADDAELDRISDFPLLAPAHTPSTSGRPIQISWMKGRVRHYTLTPADTGQPVTAVISGLNDRCDAIVATAVADRQSAPTAETELLAFLALQPVQDWIRLALARAPDGA